MLLLITNCHSSPEVVRKILVSKDEEKMDSDDEGGSFGPCHKVILYVTGDSHKGLCGDQFVPAWGVKTVAKDPLLVVGSQELVVGKPASWIIQHEKKKGTAQGKEAVVAAAQPEEPKDKEKQRPEDSEDSKDEKALQTMLAEKEEDKVEDDNQDTIMINAPTLVLVCDPDELSRESLVNSKGPLKQIGSSPFAECHGYKSIYRFLDS